MKIHSDVKTKMAGWRRRRNDPSINHRLLENEYISDEYILILRRIIILKGYILVKMKFFFISYETAQKIFVEFIEKKKCVHLIRLVDEIPIYDTL